MRLIFGFFMFSISFVISAQYAGGIGGSGDVDKLFDTRLEGTRFISSSGTNWNVDTSWNTGIVPSEAQYVIIDAEATVEIDHHLRIAGIEVLEGAEVVVAADNALQITDLFVNRGTITLKADSLGGYALLKFDGELDFAGTGSVVQQQFFKGGWHMVSSSMKTTSPSFFGKVNGSRHPNAMNFFSWDGRDFALVDSVGSAIQKGLGYYGYVGKFSGQVVGFQDIGLKSFQGIPNANADFPQLTPSSTMANANVAISGDPLIRGGWSMLGNPFTSVLDFQSLDLNGVEDAFYIFDPSVGDEGEFFSWSEGGIENPHIAPLQAFWVRSAINNPSISSVNMKDNAIIPATNPNFFRAGNSFDRVVLRSAEVANPNYKDHTVIALIENTTDGFDNGWDARKMMPSENTPGIYTIGNAEGLANNAIDYGPNRSDKKSIDLAFRASKQGANYSIRFDEDFMVNEYTIYLEDKLLGQFHDLKSGDYVFANDTNHRERFVVHFRSGALSSDLEFANAANLRAWVYENTAYIHPNVDLGRSDIRMMDMSGRTVFNTSADLRKNEPYEIALPQLKAGVYLLQVGGQKVVKVVLR